VSAWVRAIDAETPHQTDNLAEETVEPGDVDRERVENELLLRLVEAQPSYGNGNGEPVAIRKLVAGEDIC
jgi:hypothetical protein